MYLLVIIKEVNFDEILAALLPAAGLTTRYSYPLVTTNSLAFASQLITVRSLCPPPSLVAHNLLTVGFCVFFCWGVVGVCGSFSAFVRT